MRCLILLLCLALTLHLEARAESPTHTIGPTSYCLELDSAQKIAREDAKNGLEAASSLFAEADDCQIGGGQLILVGIISTHKVKRNGADRTLYVYEARNPIIGFYLITTQKLVKEDPET